MVIATLIAAIVWQACISKICYPAWVLSVVDAAPIGKTPSGSLKDCPSHKIDVYKGPKPKIVLPMIPMQNNNTPGAFMQIGNTISLPPKSSVVKQHKDNISKTKSGKVATVFPGRGPNGSMGVDMETKRRHEERIRKQSLEQLAAMDNNTSEKDEIPVTVTRQETAFPRVPANACLDFASLRHTTFVVEAYIGKPGQKFLPILDTGSTNVWAIHPECTSAGCMEAIKYDPARSKTFKPLEAADSIVRARFVSGVVLGTLGYDDFTIGGFTVKGQLFAMMRDIPDKSTNDILTETPFNGMIGLGFKDLMVMNSEPLYQRYMKVVGAEPIFSFYYSRNGVGSAFLVGGADERLHKGPMQMMPVVPGYYWQVELEEVFVGKRKVCCDKQSYAVFDTGTAFNSMPHAAINTLLEEYPFYECNAENMNRVYAALPTIKYTFSNGVQAKLTPEQYTYESEGVCRPAFMQINVDVAGGEGYLLGSMAFMPHYYTVYYGGESPMIGIAPSNHENAPKVVAEYTSKHKKA
ncbi:Eukaryotic aspartyl protease family protein [Babesia bovis T2Bo]|uniref:Eukaryotic aspartyl protease family protein n=1 Tax=Babesia bovis T2Bo TaxID=484906 RepID=UPI001DE6969C|nr:Eukaryotic aspartyl protease family protein [Babesia bovis T2Bo]EDO07389.2 Eukaryotic aspartyl protease family protein [Babesia bovis T2Bo]